MFQSLCTGACDSMRESSVVPLATLCLRRSSGNWHGACFANDSPNAPPLIWEAWRHRHNISGYDSFYVAAAHLYKVPLLTADGPLSRAPVLGIKVQNVRTVPSPP